MSRTRLWMALAVMACGVGCAQCDTCDDFPVPCVGPNCGGLMPGGIPGYFGDSMPSEADRPAQAPVMGSSTPTAAPGSDDAGPAPRSPEADPSPTPTPAPAAPEVNPSPAPAMPPR